MNEQLQQALAEILKKTLAGIDAGTAFLSNELPDVIHQLLVWQLWNHLIGMFMGIILFIAGLYAARKARKNYCEEIKEEFPETDSAGIVGVGIIAFFLIPLGLFIALDNLKTTVQIIVAPKIYLIEYVSTLSGGEK